MIDDLKYYNLTWLALPPLKIDYFLVFDLKAESILIFIDDDNINRIQTFLQYFEAEQVLSPLHFLAEQIIPLFF